MDFSEAFKGFKGEWHQDLVTRKLFATDASVYQELPQLVCYPKDEADVQLIVEIATYKGLTITPRTAGTSLGGQATGGGIVMDMSRHWSDIIDFDSQQGIVHLQPGIVRDELNQKVASSGWFFGPETSTSNRCMIGGMIGNNSCGSHSILYGSTRDHLLEVEMMLSDGQVVTFGACSEQELKDKQQVPGREGEIYRHIVQVLSDPGIRAQITEAYPKPEIRRRNTGYALDEILNQQPFNPKGASFNLAKLVAGSEGTLGVVLSAKLALSPLPPAHLAVVAVHCSSMEEAALANLVGRSCNPGAIELIDKFLLDCTKENIQQAENRYFVEGDPAALLVVEFARDSIEELDAVCQEVIAALKQEQLGYAYPIISGEDVNKVWELRKAGLGLLSNVPGDAKPVACIEDTAVTVQDLPAYLKEFEQITDKYGKECVYYAHIGDGEIHLRPVLDLKDAAEQQVFAGITEDIAKLVKKYKGSLSGEHGDGRVRSPFLKLMVGQQVYQLLVDLKNVWDPKGIFNRGKIVEAGSILKDLRYQAGQSNQQPDTLLDFSDSEGLLRMAEKCNGSADCRKSHLIGGTMCPSYMATKNENDTTRARANALRDYYSAGKSEPKLSQAEVKSVLDLCLSCKGCKSECPSNVDMAAMKSEFMSQWWRANKPPLQVRYMASLRNNLGRFQPVAGVYNAIATSGVFKRLVQPVMGIAAERSMPELSTVNLVKWYKQATFKAPHQGARVGVLLDEITSLFDASIAQKGISLFRQLGFEVQLSQPVEVGRAAMSAGMLEQAKSHALTTTQEVIRLAEQVDFIVGFEPSSLLMLRDDYHRLLPKKLSNQLKALSGQILLAEEFLLVQKAKIPSEGFKRPDHPIKVHVHCHQKSIAKRMDVQQVLQLLPDADIETLNTGCCGMSGAFGMQKEHYELSQQIAQLKLFPAVQQAGSAIICATGNSCRHQLKDGTDRSGLHPVEILFNHLIG